MRSPVGVTEPPSTVAIIERPSPLVIPLYGSTETAAKISQTVAETNAPFMKAIRDQLVLDPDSDTEDLAKALFGDKEYNAVKGTAEQIRLDTIAERQLPKFLALFSKGAKTITPGFKNIPPDKLGDIIESLENIIFGFNMFFLAVLGSLLALASASTEIMLTPKNSLLIRGQINAATATDFIYEVNKRPKKEGLYLYLDTNGGSVDAGNKIINEIAKYNISCVAERAISMGFVILQSCHTRYITPSATLMQHQMSYGVVNEKEKVESYVQFIKQIGDQLTTIEVHDIICHIADAVLAGGIRRAALISLFSAYDEEMISCKSGSWWETNPQRGRANNSAVLMRHKITKEFFLDLWKRIELSGAGEPGIYFNHDKEWGTNPCCEIALRPYQFCNLCEVNVSDVTSQEDLNSRVKAAAFIGTLQAGYTEFHYLREIWQETTEKDALIGVSMTGIASKKVLKLELEQFQRFLQ